MAMEKSVDEKQHSLEFWESFLLSGTAAVVSKTAAAPIERVKLMVQNQNEMMKQGVLAKPYKGIIDCFASVAKTEGILPFWRGNLANVLRYFPTQALNFAFKDTVKGIFATPSGAPKWEKFATNIAAGGCAGVLSLTFVYSLDYTRTRLANDAKGKEGSRKFNGIVDVYVKTFKSDGIRGLYRGFVISAVGIFVYRGMYFGLYDSLKPLVLGSDAGLVSSFLLGWPVTFTAGFIAYPLDTLRRRLMMTSGAAVKYKGSLDCASHILKNEGAMSFFKGAGANVLRGVAGAGVLAGFDSFKAIYIDWRMGN